jgi:hypothetical protein
MDATEIHIMMLCKDECIDCLFVCFLPFSLPIATEYCISNGNTVVIQVVVNPVLLAFVVSHFNLLLRHHHHRRPHQHHHNHLVVVFVHLLLVSFRATDPPPHLTPAWPWRPQILGSSLAWP